MCPRNGDLLRGRVLSARWLWWVNQTPARRSRNPSRNSRPYIRAYENHWLSFHEAEKITVLFLGAGHMIGQVFHQKNKDIDTMDTTWLELNFARVSKYKAAVYHPDVLTMHLYTFKWWIFHCYVSLPSCILQGLTCTKLNVQFMARVMI